MMNHDKYINILARGVCQHCSCTSHTCYICLHYVAGKSHASLTDWGSWQVAGIS